MSGLDQRGSTSFCDFSVRIVDAASAQRARKILHEDPYISLGTTVLTQTVDMRAAKAHAREAEEGFVGTHQDTPRNLT